ncbi:hypothetical protein A11A3_00650 [Alcanivorax hongdengensis A-11-3]|uniref:Guanylate cyclase domain-containing protein n=1 Tax=Alcanivorax hongdengensis A-11-3 TaxID=1177179 RepID=L0WGJ0_9GAMM|nr:hypothetical protein [Alcanivorax hongdengensis]EKF75958.1 hypothetical protein A11A3_00650 [Alcanivorax hongdengensis A-11-3]
MPMREQWRWLREQRPLLRELVAMLVVALVVGVYFLQNFSDRLADEQKVQLQALAQQTASRAAEALASGDSISANLIGRETLALKPVAGIRIDDVGGAAVVSLGKPQAGPVAQAPVAMPDGELAGMVTLRGAERLVPRKMLEAGFVVAVLCLLLLRVAIALVARRLLPETVTPAPAPVAPAAPVSPPQAPLVPACELPAEGEDPGPVTASLCLSIVNFDHFQQRYTREALQAALADYCGLLNKVAALYGGRVQGQVGEQARLTFHDPRVSQAAFAALCAGLLFLRVGRLWAPLRKAHGAQPLEFKALVTTDDNAADAWSLCVAGVPGRLQVPEAQLAEAELDVKALYQPDKVQVVRAGDHKVRLQPVEQLAHRYQSLLRTQAETLVSELGDEGGAENR